MCYCDAHSVDAKALHTENLTKEDKITYFKKAEFWHIFLINDIIIIIMQRIAKISQKSMQKDVTWWDIYAFLFCEVIVCLRDYRNFYLFKK